jgi:hypothetical protein
MRMLPPQAMLCDLPQNLSNKFKLDREPHSTLVDRYRILQAAITAMLRISFAEDTVEQI